MTTNASNSSPQNASLEEQLAQALADAQAARTELSRAQALLNGVCSPATLAAANAYGRTPLGEALAAGDIDRVRFLAPRSNLEAPVAPDKMTPLMYVASTQGTTALECARALLDSAPDPLALIKAERNFSPWAALGFAAERNNDILWLLVERLPVGELTRERKSQVREKEPTLASRLLLRAAKAGNAASVIELAPLADVNVMDGYHCPLSLAAAAGSAECVKALLTAGARVRHQKQEPIGAEHPLAMAIASESEACVRLLAPLSDLEAWLLDGSTFVTLGIQHSKTDSSLGVVRALLSHCSPAALELKRRAQGSGGTDLDVFEYLRKLQAVHPSVHLAHDALLSAFIESPEADRLELSMPGFAKSIAMLRKSLGDAKASAKFPRAIAALEGQAIRQAISKPAQTQLSTETPAAAPLARNTTRL